MPLRDAALDQMPVEAFLDAYPAEIRAAAEDLRSIVKDTVPDAIERVRLGWRLIAYDLPLGRGKRFFAYISPEPIHIHLGFEYGAWMADPNHQLEGTHLRLKKVRYLTFQPGQRIARPAAVRFVREGARVALMSREERWARLIDRGWDQAV